MRMPPISRRQTIAYAIVVLALLALVGRSVVGGDGETGDAASPPDAVAVLTVDQEGQDAEPPGSLLVHVAGAVRNPGVYELAVGSRVADAVEHAGGPRARAALEGINLAAALVDGQQVVVPTRVRSATGAGAGQAGEVADAGPAGATAGAGTSVSSGPISLSLASATQLQELPGVGPVTAERIVAHREEHGPFRAVDELAAVSGIGSARIEAIRYLVTP